MSGRQARAVRYWNMAHEWRKRERKESDRRPLPTIPWDTESLLRPFYAPRRLRRSVHRMYRHHREGR